MPVSASKSEAIFGPCGDGMSTVIDWLSKRLGVLAKSGYGDCQGC